MIRCLNCQNYRKKGNKNTCVCHTNIEVWGKMQNDFVDYCSEYKPTKAAIENEKAKKRLSLYKKGYSNIL